MSPGTSRHRRGRRPPRLRPHLQPTSKRSDASDDSTPVRCIVCPSKRRADLITITPAARARHGTRLRCRWYVAPAKKARRPSTRVASAKTFGEWRARRAAAAVIHRYETSRFTGAVLEARPEGGRPCNPCPVRHGDPRACLHRLVAAQLGRSRCEGRTDCIRDDARRASVTRERRGCTVVCNGSVIGAIGSAGLRSRRFRAGEGVLALQEIDAAWYREPRTAYAGATLQLQCRRRSRSLRPGIRSWHTSTARRSATKRGVRASTCFWGRAWTLHAILETAESLSTSARIRCWRARSRAP